MKKSSEQINRENPSTPPILIEIVRDKNIFVDFDEKRSKFIAQMKDTIILIANENENILH